MIRISEQLCTQTMITEDRLRMQSVTIKIDGREYRLLKEIYNDAISDAQFQNLPMTEWPKMKDLITDAIRKGIDRIYMEL